MCVLSMKVPIRKKSGNLFNDPRILRQLIFHNEYKVIKFSSLSELVLDNICCEHSTYYKVRVGHDYKNLIVFDFRK